MKKKTISVFLVLLLAVAVLTGCTPKNPAPAPTADPEPDPSSVESQLALLAENVSVWGDPDESVNSAVYCVTDLDHNGRLEVLFSFVMGTGYFSYTTVHEVNETFDGISRVNDSALKDSSQPDLLFYDKFRTYETDGTYAYICEDVIRNGYAEAEFYKETLSLVDGVLSCEFLGGIEARVERVKEEDVLYASYYDEQGHNISPEDFAALETYWFPENAVKSVTRFGWTKFEADADFAAGLKASYETFGPGIGYTADDDLFEYPHNFYNMKENVVSGTGDDGMFGFPYERELCSFWTFTVGETEGWEWNADEEGVSGWIEFRPEGTVTFSYTDPNGEETRYEDMEVSVDYVPLFDGCENEDWSVVFRGDETNEFAASTVNGVLTVLWFQGPYDGEEYPALCAMRFER